jgi:N-dimethylarginine dimethylaminohydrolase
LPDLVFTANAALISGGLAILSSFRHPERRREQRAYRSVLAQHGFATTFLQQTFFEGAGDALFDRVRPCCTRATAGAATAPRPRRSPRPSACGRCR